MGDLKAEDRALIVRVLGSIWGNIFEQNPGNIGLLLDAAREEGRQTFLNDASRAGRSIEEFKSRHPKPSQEAETLLEWFSSRPALSLEYGYPDELDAGVWQVHRVSGGINDREWELIGSGLTALEAMTSARAPFSGDRG